jgi:hypothetical protein
VEHPELLEPNEGDIDKELPNKEMPVHFFIEMLATPALIVDRSGKIANFNLPSKALLKRSGRLLARKLEVLFPDVPWTKFIEQAEVTGGAISETIAISITRGETKKKHHLQCLFIPTPPEGTERLTMVLFLQSKTPAVTAETAEVTPESMLTKLRDPLTVALGHLEMLMEKREVAPEQREFHLKKIYSGAATMARLLNAARPI